MAGATQAVPMLEAGEGSRPSAATKRVRIKAASLVTPLGRSAWSTASALLDGGTTAERVRRLARELLEGARVDATDLARATASAPLRASGAGDRAIDLAGAALAQLEAPLAGAAAFVASSKGAISPILPQVGTSAQVRWQGEFAGEAQASCAALGPHGWLAATLRERFELGVATCVVAACASGLTALDRAARAIRSGNLSRAVVVAVEASLHPLFVSGYQRLGALAPTTPVEAHVALPLDARRRGFTLCECAAAVLLEAEEAAASSGAPSAGADSALMLTGTLRATACATEPFDVVRAAPRFTAVERVARRLLDEGADVDEPVALLQPHATGTADNDARELAALASALGRQRAGAAAVYAHKGAIGHAMGASGLVGLVLSLVFARCGRTPPMPWLKAPIDAGFALSRASQPLQPGLHMILSAGFGGHVAGTLVEA